MNPESGCKTGTPGDGGDTSAIIDSRPRASECAVHCWEEMTLVQKSNDEVHWMRTRNLMFAHLGVWFFFGYIIHMFVKPLNAFTVPFLGFPLGFYMAAQGSLIVFV